MKKLVLCLILCAVLALGLLPVTANAAEIPGTVTADAVWNAGDTFGSYVTIDGGTETDPLTIQVNGIVEVSRQIYIAGGYVQFTGGGTLLRASDNTTNNVFYVSGGTLVLDQITIDGASVSTSASAIDVYSGHVIMNAGATVQNNTKSSSRGGAVELDGGAFTMNGGTLKNNSVTQYGGAVMIDNGASFTMNGGLIDNNHATDTGVYGGGAFYVRGPLTITGGTISNNSAVSRGGAIYNASYATTNTTISGATFTGNKVAEGGTGNGIFHSCRTSSSAVLTIGQNANIQDDIYLDYDDSPKRVNIAAPLTDRLTFTCAKNDAGTVIAQGLQNADGTAAYNVTKADMAKMSVSNSGLGLKLENNEVSLTDTVSTEYPLYVAYDTNGGEGGPSGQEYTVSPDAPSATVTIAFSPLPTYEGYTFLGWDTDKTAQTPAYTAGGLTQITITENTTLYAIWQVIPTQPGGDTPPVPPVPLFPALPTAHSVPKTGDNSPILLWGAMLLVSLAGTVMLRKRAIKTK